jgi:hypothetical protein
MQYMERIMTAATTSSGLNMAPATEFLIFVGSLALLIISLRFC